MISRKDVELERQTCAACPTQWEGTLTDGRWFYFRYRHGTVAMGVGYDLAEAIHNSWRHQAAYGDDLDGVLSIEEYIKWFDTLGRLIA